MEIELTKEQKLAILLTLSTVAIVALDVNLGLSTFAGAFILGFLHMLNPMSIVILLPILVVLYYFYKFIQKNRYKYHKAFLAWTFIVGIMLLGFIMQFIFGTPFG